MAFANYWIPAATVHTRHNCAGNRLGIIVNTSLKNKRHKSKAFHEAHPNSSHPSTSAFAGKEHPCSALHFAGRIGNSTYHCQLKFPSGRSPRDKVNQYFLERGDKQ
ncbi:predicted protein [Sclerotinia sclerotiorum 1980 UF-70]|uniref:Uncharacterized protein n=1 Tax=Sclerotinia sclerotiorum (strain ATCC 18683 / 1980 / Ss-1) TaxID=665079 RepID=A7E765_SCLS1|nr:predicted protein [Sclerotinia sclerotiorum 1980 UF-70]EDN96217.1 predicted protein [Sclerotinia sclerotiorum 1980 UF-70]